MIPGEQKGGKRGSVQQAQRCLNPACSNLRFLKYYYFPQFSKKQILFASLWFWTPGHTAAEQGDWWRFQSKATEKYQKPDRFSQARKHFYLSFYFNKCCFHEGGNLLMDGIIPFQICSYFLQMSLAFKFCLQNHNERLFAVTYSTN